MGAQPGVHHDLAINSLEVAGGVVRGDIVLSAGLVLDFLAILVLSRGGSGHAGGGRVVFSVSFVAVVILATIITVVGLSGGLRVNEDCDG